MAFPPIPVRMPIVDAARTINIFFRQRWEELRTAASRVGAVGVVTLATKTAGSLTNILATVTTGGLYRVAFTARRTVADGVSSSLTVVWHWTDGGVANTKTETANGTDTIASLYSETRLLPCDANTNITADITYASNTPAKMTYTIKFTVEQLVQA